VRRAGLCFLPASIAAQMAQRLRCTHSGGASIIIRRCVRTLATSVFQEALAIAKFEPGVYELCEPSHPAARQSERRRDSPAILLCVLEAAISQWSTAEARFAHSGV